MSTNINDIKKLRELTLAPLNECKIALQETNGDFDKAVDFVKAKGLQNTSSREGKATSEGIVKCRYVGSGSMVLIEVLSQTDFTARSPEFLKFASLAVNSIADVFHTISSQFQCNLSDILADEKFDVNDIKIDEKTLGDYRKELIALTRENIQINRYWLQEVSRDNQMVWSYIHSNNKLGVLVSLEAETAAALDTEEFASFADGVAMQIAAMSPLALSSDELSQEEIDRQKAIFEVQLTEANKPQASWPKIMEGKLQKWFSEVCLLDQVSVLVPKTTIRTLADTAKVKIISFVRCSVGSNVEKKEDNFAAEVAKLTGE